MTEGGKNMIKIIASTQTNYDGSRQSPFKRDQILDSLKNKEQEIRSIMSLDVDMYILAWVLEK